MSPWRTPLVALVAVFTLLAPAVAFAEVPPVLSPHRALGVSGFAENSLAAFSAAAQAGETDIEGDVFVTKDLAFVLSPRLAAARAAVQRVPTSTARCARSPWPRWPR